MTIPVAIYCRVSTEVQQERGYSLQEQEHICHQYAEQRQYDVVGVYRDDVSGTTFNRPGLNQILELARQDKIRIVLIQELDRLA